MSSSADSFTPASLCRKELMSSAVSMLREILIDHGSKARATVLFGNILYYGQQCMYSKAIEEKHCSQIADI